MANLVGLILIAALSLTSDQNFFFSSVRGQELEETRIECHPDETHHFHYTSTSKLWGNAGGDVLVTADILLHCMGEDVIEEEASESRGLRFLAEITYMKVEPQGNNETGTPVEQGFQPDDRPDPTPEEMREFYAVPFQFLQLPFGSVPVIWFAEYEVEDSQIRNFKRHLVDTFATHLVKGEEHEDIVEYTITGQHMSTYGIKFSDEPLGPMFAQGLGVPEGQTVLVDKTVNEKQIIQLSPSDAINNKEKLNLHLRQTQIFKGGKLMQSTGTSSIAIRPKTIHPDRYKRDTGEDAASNFQAESSFHLQLQRRYRRSTEEAARLEMHQNIAFVPASRFADNDKSFEKEKVRELQKTLGDLTHLFQGLLDSRDVQSEGYEKKMLTMADLVQKEVQLQVDNEPQSASAVIRAALTKDVLLSMCNEKFIVCMDFLQLLSFAGGAEAEEVFLSFLQTQPFEEAYSQIIGDIIADIPHPSPFFIDALVEFMSDEQQSIEVRGPLSLSCGTLGSRADLDTKSKISQMLTNLLATRESPCESPEFMIDLLEAIGNLNSQETVPTVLEVSSTCRGSGAIQIACTHALRHHVNLPPVMLWIKDMLDYKDCEVVSAIVRALSEKIQHQELVGDSSSWPRSGFNEVDEKLEDLLSSSGCSVQDIILYLSKKSNQKAKDLANKHYSPVPWNSEQRSMTSYQHECTDWVSLDKLPPIQTQREHDADKEYYNVKKHCLHRRRFGVDNANLEFSSGMLSASRKGSRPFESKQLIHASFNVHFLSAEKSLVSFAFYTKTGKVRGQRLYAQFFGYSRPLISRTDCIILDLNYDKRLSIPVWSLNIYILKISLSIDIIPHLGLQGSCPVKTLYMLEPNMGLRVEGNAAASIINVYGSLSLGGNLGARLELMVLPGLCFGGNIGTDPMSISIRAYYQIWWPFKGWSGEYWWKPPFLSWDLVAGRKVPMFKNFCLL